jgi:hypothetical protein
MASWPGAAFAQVIKLVEQTSSATSYTFRGDKCSNSIVLQWNYANGLTTNTGSMRLWSTAGTCGDGPDAGDPSFDPVDSTTWAITRQGTLTVPLAGLPIFSSSDGGVTCGEAGHALPAYVCAGLDVQGTYGSTPAPTKASFKVTYDTKPPSVPSSVSCSAEDSALRCSYNVDSDTTKVIATARAEGVDGASIQGTPSSGGGTVRLSGLTNGVAYTVGIRAIDAAGNESDELQSAAVTPVLTQGFFGELRADGSTEEGNGGCSTAGATLLPFAAVILLRARARRSER